MTILQNDEVNTQYKYLLNYTEIRFFEQKSRKSIENKINTLNKVNFYEKKILRNK